MTEDGMAAWGSCTRLCESSHRHHEPHAAPAATRTPLATPNPQVTALHADFAEALWCGRWVNVQFRS